ncbi:MBL fold metallo-hydrolase [Candidatus Pelagibacter communis]|uniref:MBL fold metallo-hydrolase n=1 Tax=Pelagibacter ubique TaxID=198252 RepID=UPI00094D4917|nr:MBL fold metallo-hydrolase [Candidatus Pelagibacter ubique]
MKFIILGCGSSMGVPRPDGFFGNCNPKNKKNFRSRCSALIKTKSETVLIDTSPDLRQQLINNNIEKIDKVFYSHMHADQTHGINDLRVFYIKDKKTIPVFADKPTRKYLLNAFGYCFTNNNKEYPATLKLNSISKNLKITDGKKRLKIKAVKVKHGKIDSICYIVDKKLAYISDISDIHKKNYIHFKNLKYLIIDCLWLRYHPSHLNLEKTLKFIKIFKPKKAVLTNLHSDLDYNFLKKKLPKNIFPAYDGMTINL